MPPAPARRRGCRRSCSSLRAGRGRTDCRAPQSILPGPPRSPVRTHTTLRNVGSQSRIRRLVHQRQRSSDAFVGDEAEERRLLELHRESLSQRIVEHRIAGRVGELGEHDRVLVGQRRRTAAIDHARDGGGDDDGGRADREPPRAATPGRRSRRHRCVRPRLRRSRSVRRSAAC